MCCPGKNRENRYNPKILTPIEDLVENEYQQVDENLLSLPNHIDNPFLDPNFDYNDGLHGFVYETQDSITVVYTTDEAYYYYEFETLI